MQRFDEHTFLLFILIGISLITLYALLSEYAFYLMDSVGARLTYIILTIIAQVIPIVKRQEKYIGLSYFLLVIPWTVLYFNSMQSLAFQSNALSAYNWDIYLRAYGSNGHITLLESRGDYVGFHIISHLILAVGLNNYPELILMMVLLGIFLLVLVSIMCFRAIKRDRNFDN